MTLRIAIPLAPSWRLDYAVYTVGWRARFRRLRSVAAGGRDAGMRPYG
ncbi:hypothetical protein [Embleya sp. NBC_00896]|nr:hypothetical protein OG928_40290 [Embleya sp. NBC_00896]